VKILKNPLLDQPDLPAFTQITSDMIEPAIQQILQDNRELIKQLQDLTEVNWENLIQPLEIMDDRLNKAWSPVRHLNSVKSSDELREAYNQCLPMLSEYSTEIGQNQKLYQAYKSIAQSEDFSELSQAQKKTITDSLKHFELAGVGLSGEAKKEYQMIQKELSELQSRFENNVLDANQSWEKTLESNDRLSGLPEYALAMLKQNAESKSLQGYRLTLDMPCYIAIVTYADDRELRKEIYQAYSTRASDQGITDKKWDNAEIMLKILQKRQQKAALLGFNNYAELSLETKMAKDVNQVIDFLSQMADKSHAAAKQEYQQLQEFAQNNGLDDDIQAWDIAYYSEKQRKQLFEFSDEDLKPYFSDNRVIQGLFDIVEKLFSINIKQVNEGIELWHKDVRFYQIFDEQQRLIGQFYLDLYAREHKRGGAWMDECINRHVIGDNVQLPVAYLTCNLTPPVGDEPALFTHDEVITLFHEFGHGIHHMLTEVDVPEVSGINGVEWDAVELPSQFMENFCWQREALDLFARHYQTHEALPENLYNRMIAAKNYQSAMQMVRQLEFSIFDIKLHQLVNIETTEQIQQIVNEVREQVAVIIPPSFNRFQNSFSHIFAGGYAAGYYSYKWAEVLSADAFSRFEEEGVFNPQTGRKFLQCILQKGGMRPALESFICFMGREPEIDALLRHNGIESVSVQ
jgi:oligopeptidase A